MGAGAPVDPGAPPHLKGGRPAEEDRQMLSAILYVLLGGAATCANPTDRGKRGTKHSQLSDG